MASSPSTSTVDLNVGLSLPLTMAEWLHYLNLEIVVLGYFSHLASNEDIDFLLSDERFPFAASEQSEVNSNVRSDSIASLHTHTLSLKYTQFSDVI